MCNRSAHKGQNNTQENYLDFNSYTNVMLKRLCVWSKILKYLIYIFFT